MTVQIYRLGRSILCDYVSDKPTLHLDKRSYDLPCDICGIRKGRQESYGNCSSSRLAGERASYVAQEYSVGCVCTRLSIESMSDQSLEQKSIKVRTIKKIPTYRAATLVVARGMMTPMHAGTIGPMMCHERSFCRSECQLLAKASNIA
jgi:hypothetical protein